MRVLLDQCAPNDLLKLLADFDITSARSLGWAETEDGTLADLAQRSGFDLLLTVDKNLTNQQNWDHRTIALLVLHSQNINIILRYHRRIVRAIRSAQPGSIQHIDMPKF